MTYLGWFEDQAEMHENIMKKLIYQGYTKSQIIAYFEFDNMVKEEPDFCPLYAKNKKCHDLEYLSCYLCACPNFRFNDNGIEKQEDNTQYSFCDIDSKDGEQSLYGNKIHQNCSACSVPHNKEYVEKHFDKNWKKIMKNCPL